MPEYYFALDLIDDPELISAYERWHKHENQPEAVRKSLTDAGITNLEIYRTANRLFMKIEADDTFSPERKAAMDRVNAAVQNWEQLMWQFQKRLPWSQQDEKWVMMERMYSLHP